MRITFILPHAGLSGGVRIIAIYAQRLQQRGHDVTIVSTRYRWPTRRERLYWGARNALKRMAGWKDPSHLNDIGVKHHVIGHDPPIVDADVPESDVVLATWWETAEWVQALSSSKGAKAYFIQAYEAHEGQPIDRVLATWRLPLRKVVVSQWLGRVGREELGAEDVTVVPNGIDLEQFSAEPRGRCAVPTFGVMYTLHPVKRAEVCIDAFERIRAGHPEARLVSFGVEQRSVIESRLPEQTRYFCQPAQDELRTIYASCDAWLLGSRLEGFGLPILEAMACRTPAIATPAGAAGELLADGGGILLAGEDPVAEMVDAMEQIIALSDEQWRAMSQQARNTAERFGWDASVDRFERFLRETAGEQADSATPAHTVKRTLA